MSEADKMFEDIDYEKIIDNEETEEYLYKDKIFSCMEKHIIFDKEHNLLNFRTDNVSNYETITTILNIQELQAITKKVEELKWEKKK